MENLLSTYLKLHSKGENLVLDEDCGFDLSFQLSKEGDTVFYVYKTKNTVSNNYLRYLEEMDSLYKKYDRYNKKGCSLGSMSTVDGRIVLGYSKGMDFNVLEDITELEKLILEDVDAIIIKAVSAKDYKEFEVFNSAQNGYDALTAKNKFTSKTPRFVKSICKKCGNDTFELFIKVHNTGRQDLLKDQPCEQITEENWTNAFDWIIIDKKCSRCGHKTKKWFEMETM